MHKWSKCSGSRQEVGFGFGFCFGLALFSALLLLSSLLWHSLRVCEWQIEHFVKNNANRALRPLGYAPLTNRAATEDTSGCHLLDSPSKPLAQHFCGGFRGDLQLCVPQIGMGLQALADATLMPCTNLQLAMNYSAVQQLEEGTPPPNYGSAQFAIFMCSLGN